MLLDDDTLDGATISSVGVVDDEAAVFCLSLIACFAPVRHRYGMAAWIVLYAGLGIHFLRERRVRLSVKPYALIPSCGWLAVL